tara:strand:+ start:385 stop:843 length:459 start_codon:yes stop_codon:yes gene_type:complete
MANIIPTESRCGDCTVCCEIMGFTGQWASADRYNEADKLGVDYGAWNTCNKLCDTGCSIQNKKPQICDEFFCSYIEYDLEDHYRPKDCGFVAHVQKWDGAVGILSMDKTLPPDIQYNNNKKLLDNLIEEILISEGRKLDVWLHTKQGTYRLR